MTTYVIEAMGGKLKIRAVFPDGDVKIDLLNKLSARTAAVGKPSASGTVATKLAG